MSSPTMEVVVGTYEELILGYKINKTDEGYELEQSFTDHNHGGCVKAIAVSSKGMQASGSSDESIRLLNLKNRKEHGTLRHHDGTITWLDFYKGTHMFSCSDDGTIGIWKTNKWDCIKTLKGHKGPVNCIAVHPSGKMALSVSRDKTLRTWNLMTARTAFITNIKQIADMVLWSTDGDKYAIVVQRTVDVYNVETAAVEYSIASDFRVNFAVFVNNNILAVGGEGGDIHFYDVNRKEKVYEFSTNTNRIKSLHMCSCPDDPGSQWLVSASSDGTIAIWEITLDKDDTKHLLVCSVNTTFRPICLAVRTPPVETEVKTEVKTEMEEDEEVEIKEEDSSEEEEVVEEVKTEICMIKKKRKPKKSALLEQSQGKKKKKLKS